MKRQPRISRMRDNVGSALARGKPSYDAEGGPRSAWRWIGYMQATLEIMALELGLAEPIDGWERRDRGLTGGIEGWSLRCHDACMSGAVA